LYNYASQIILLHGYHSVLERGTTQSCLDRRLQRIYFIFDTYLPTYLPTHSLTHSMVQDIIWKADCH